MPAAPFRLVHLLVLLSGVAGLSWELLWQHDAALAIGVSAQGTAITLACTMGGLALGSFLAGRWLAGRLVSYPGRLLAALESAVGVLGLCLPAAFAGLARLDAAVFGVWAAAAPVVQLLGIAAVLGPPAMAMGATLPVFALLARAHGTRLATLYATNTAGAAAGVLLAAFVVIPACGFRLTGVLAASVNLTTAAGALWLRGRAASASQAALARRPALIPLRLGVVLAALTGFVTFALEVAWFRSMRAAFHSTTEVFAVLLFAVLLPLAVGARIAPWLRARRPRALGLVPLAGGMLVLLVTPVVERFDRVPMGFVRDFYQQAVAQLALALAALCLPVGLLGMSLPWLLEEHPDPHAAGRLYAVNTLGAVAGALAAGWLLLPGIGAVATGWAAGVALGLGSLPFLARRARLAAAGVLAVALSAAVALATGVGRVRVQAPYLADDYRVLDTREGPDATVSVVEVTGGTRHLVIDGFMAAADESIMHYAVWMGRLPAIMHPDPRRALVICFGTGQTANAVRREGVEAIDIVELSPAVIAMAPHFRRNDRVTADPRVRVIVMDGRAWLRRTDATYDLITLEPMAPHFAGANALYSLEFYQAARKRLAPGGVVAQWLPMHLTSPFDTASIAATFAQIFPDAWIWVDPIDQTGILLGRAGPPGPLTLPGIDRTPLRNLPPIAVRGAFLLDPAGIQRLAASGAIITDDNELLSYGPGRQDTWRYPNRGTMRFVNVEKLRALRQ